MPTASYSQSFYGSFGSILPSAEATLCGSTGQQCCKPKFYQLFTNECNFSKDKQTKYDKDGIRIPFGDVSRVAVSCRCMPPTKVYGADKLCSRYFSPSNYSRIVEPGILDPNKNAVLTQDKIDRLNEELNSCLKCVEAEGFYTAVGCMPFEINTLVKGIIILGLLFGGVLTLLCIVFSAIKIQASKGDSAKVSKAQETIKSCITGLILIIFSAFIINVLGSGIFGFSIVEPFQQVLKGSKGSPDPILECTRPCIYSEKHDTDTKCFAGACPNNEADCGKEGGKLDKNALNKGCKYASMCGNSKEVECPSSLNVTPTPDPSGSPIPTVVPTSGPVLGGPTLVTSQMIADAVVFHRELSKSCGGELHLADMSCVDRVNVPIANLDVIKKQLKDEMIGYGGKDLQCVGYVKAFMSLYTGLSGAVWPSRHGNAASLLEPLILTYPNFKQYELAFINKNSAPPLPGDFAKFRDNNASGEPGHIALVNGTINDTQFTVLQANLGSKYTECPGCISAMVVDRSNPRLTGYYRWQKQP